MKIAHVVTLVSADGAYGGPLSVASSQVGELCRRGHQLTLYAGWDGQGRVSLPPEVDVRLHRAYRLVSGVGVSGLLAPALFADLALRIKSHDVVHLHLGRDPISASSSLMPLLRRVPYVTQTHGMVAVDPRIRARAVDALITRRVLRGASRVFALTEEEQAALTAVAGTLAIAALPNGVFVERDQRWKSTISAHPPEVLFCARLHPRKRVLAFAEMAAELVDRGVDAVFTVVGPDGGDLAALREFVTIHGLQQRITYEGPVEPSRVRARLERATVFVLPSVDEPFPMTVLEALSSGTPTVVTDSCHIAGDLARRGAVAVSGSSPMQLADVVHGLLGNPERQAELRTAGFEALGDAYGIESVVDNLEASYARVIQGRSR
jgi:glycosyltransferase involved in cell wall biosynthesis